MKEQYDILVVGELNVDIIMHNIDTFPEVGKEVLAQQMTLTLGSSSAIFASNIASLGARVAFLGKIGNDEFGRLILHELRQRNVDISMITRENHLNTGSTIVLAVEEDRANITYPGAMNHLTIKDISRKDLMKARHLHFSSCFMQPGIKDDLGELFRMAKEMNMTTSFDMQWDPHEKWDLKKEEILPFVDVFLPNERELLALTARDTLSDAIDSIRELIHVLVIKRGNRGSLLYYHNHLHDFPAYLNKQIIDTVGAGDSFNAGFIYKFINHFDVEECQAYGNLTGALSTTAAGGVKAFENYESLKETAKKRFNTTLE